MVIRENLLLYFLDTLGLDLVHQSAEDDSILENLCEVSRGKLFIKYSLDPLGNRTIKSTVLCCLLLLMLFMTAVYSSQLL